MSDQFAASMRLYIDLSPAEAANMRAWVDYYLAHPQYIGVPSGNWNNGAPNYQSRIVLEEQTRARFDQLAAQFAVPPPSVGEGDIPYGDFERREFMSAVGVVTSWSFRVPTGPFPGPNGSLLRLSIAEYGGSPHERRTCVSRIKGELNDGFVAQGKETMLGLFCGTDLPLGELWYINTTALAEPPNGSGQSSVSIIWPPLVWP